MEQVWDCSNCSTLYIQGFRQGLACCSSSQAYLLWNLRSDIYIFFSVKDNFECFRMGSLHKKIQLMLVFLKTILGPTLFLLYINDLLDIICNIAIYADDTTLYSLVWSGIWSVATARLGFWTWIWSGRHWVLGQEVSCCFECCQNSSCFVRPV